MLALRLLAEGAEGPNTELLWLLYIGIALFFLAILLGWWFGSGKQEPVQVRVEAGVSKPKREKAKDDLVKIEGIGPKTVKILNKAGIETFEDLASANAGDVQNLLNAAGLQMMNPEGWIDQAKLAAKGDWDGFEKLQRELKGGRRKK